MNNPNDDEKLAIQRGIEVLNKIAKHRMSHGNFSESNMRVKLSDLRDVLNAMLETRPVVKQYCKLSICKCDPPYDPLCGCFLSENSVKEGTVTSEDLLNDVKEFSGYMTEKPVKPCEHEWDYSFHLPTGPHCRKCGVSNISSKPNDRKESGEVDKVLREPIYLTCDGVLPNEIIVNGVSYRKTGGQ